LFVKGNDEKEFARALAQLMDDPDSRLRMGAFGRLRVEKELAWSHSVPRLLSAYHCVFAEAQEQRVPIESLASPKRGADRY
jgi:glycosyltransferase involved in cell wall biosynthesis